MNSRYFFLSLCLMPFIIMPPHPIVKTKQDKDAERNEAIRQEGFKRRNFNGCEPLERFPKTVCKEMPQGEGTSCHQCYGNQYDGKQQPPFLPLFTKHNGLVHLLHGAKSEIGRQFIFTLSCQCFFQSFILHCSACLIHTYSFFRIRWSFTFT